MKAIFQKIEAKQLKTVPELAVGDTVKAVMKVIEGEKERLQSFEGVLIARRGEGISQTVKIRKISYGVGVERNIPVHSPRLQEISVVKKGKARRAKLLYLRKRVGKEALKVQQVKEAQAETAKP